MGYMFAYNEITKEWDFIFVFQGEDDFRHAEWWSEKADYLEYLAW